MMRLSVTTLVKPVVWGSGARTFRSVHPQVGELLGERHDRVLAVVERERAGRPGDGPPRDGGGELAARAPDPGREPSVYSSPDEPQSSDAAYTEVGRTTALR